MFHHLNVCSELLRDKTVLENMPAKDDLLIAFSTALTGSKTSEKRLQLYLIKHLLTHDDRITWSEIDTLLDDYSNCSITGRRAVELLRECGLFYEDNKGFWVKKEIMLGKKPVVPTNLLKLLENPLPMLPSRMEADIIRAIKKGFAWCVDITLRSKDSGMRGLPAFFTCHKDNDEIIGIRPAGTAVSDALALMCEGVDYLQALELPPETLAQVFVFLTERVLDFQVRDMGWDHGGFLPMEDQPEAAHPTVDATCLAVMALCSLFENAKSISNSSEYDYTELLSRLTIAVIEGLRFLFRMQLPDGSYGIYKFEKEQGASSIFTVAHENSTRWILATMGTAKGSGIFDHVGQIEFYAKCNDIIEKAFSFMLEHMANVDGTKMWLPQFAKELKRLPLCEGIASTGRVCRSLRPVWYAIEKERTTILELLDKFCQKCVKDFPSTDMTSYYNFTSPGENGYSTFYNWRAHADILAAYTLLEAYVFYDIHLSIDAWVLIETTVYNTLQRQHHEHGHWNDPDSKKPFISATLAAIELLKYYLAATKKKALERH